jgi:hypothetical protein
MKYRIKYRKGFALFSVVLISIISVILVIPLIAWPVNEYSWTIRSFKSLKALNLADAGAEFAIWEIMHNGAQFTGWTGAGNSRSYDINPLTNNAAAAVGGVEIVCLETASDNYLITSTGIISFPGSAAVTKTVKVKLFPRSLFNNGIFGYDSVTASGNTVVDSYDSSAGAYVPGAGGNNGDIGTNGTLTLADNALLKSDIFVGPSSTIVGDVSSHVTGETYYAAAV